MMVLRSKYFFVCYAVILFMGSGCGDEITPEQASETSADVIEEKYSSDADDDSNTEDEVENLKTREKVEKLKIERNEKLDEKINASPFKGLSDDEIKTEFEGRLKTYMETCDTAIVNKISDQMAFDAALSSFKERQEEFSRSYFRKLQKAKKSCN
jgi:hypothetical protein